MITALNNPEHHNSRSVINLLTFFMSFQHEWYAEYSREDLPEQDQSPERELDRPVSDPSSFPEPQLNSQTGPHRVNE